MICVHDGAHMLGLISAEEGGSEVELCLISHQWRQIPGDIPQTDQVVEARAAHTQITEFFILLNKGISKGWLQWQYLHLNRIPWKSHAVYKMENFIPERLVFSFHFRIGGEGWTRGMLLTSVGSESSLLRHPNAAAQTGNFNQWDGRSDKPYLWFGDTFIPLPSGVSYRLKVSGTKM